jgi:hypothetical protein
MRDVSPRTYTIPIYSSYHVNKTQFSKSVIFQKKKLRFSPKTLASNMSIKDNDNYKPHAKIYSDPSCLTKLSRKQEIVTDGRYYYIPLRYRDSGGIIKDMYCKF